MDAKFKVPPSLLTKRKKTPLSLGVGKQCSSCETAAVAVRLGSLLEVSAVAAAVSASASRCSGLQDIGEKRFFSKRLIPSNYLKQR